MEVIGQIVGMIVSNTWDLLQIEVPLIGLTFFELFAGIFVVTLSINIASALFGLGNREEKGGNSRKIRVDDRRVEDTK